MDNKGLIFTLDSALALVPVLIVIVAVMNIGYSGLSPSSKHLRSVHDAQDTLEIMATPNSLNNSILQKMAAALSRNNASGIGECGNIAGIYLSNTLGNTKYCLMEINQLNKTITSSGDMINASEISVGLKSCEGYVFKLYIWD